MARRKSRGRPNPPQIHICTEGKVRSFILTIRSIENTILLIHQLPLYWGLIKMIRPQAI